MFLTRQRLGKQVPAKSNTQEKTEELPFLRNGDVNTPT
jgi:hypothetical protein